MGNEFQCASNVSISNRVEKVRLSFTTTNTDRSGDGLFTDLFLSAFDKACQFVEFAGQLLQITSNGCLKQLRRVLGNPYTQYSQSVMGYPFRDSVARDRIELERCAR